jgi:hypothetical protein
MPRGRKSAVRYYFDSVTGSVIAVAKEGVGSEGMPPPVIVPPGLQLQGSCRPGAGASLNTDAKQGRSRS